MLLLALSGCVAGRIGVSWPAVGTIDYQGQTHIALAYNNDVVLLNPSNGAPARLINPIDNQPLRDSEGNPRTWILRGTDNDGSQFFSLPLRLDSDTLLIADNNKRLLRVDSVLVEVQRSSPLPDKVVADTLAVDGVLYVPLQNGGISAISLEDLSELWHFPTESGMWAKPLLVQGRLIVPSVDHYLYALDPQTGTKLWAVDLGGAIASTPLYARERLYVGSFNKNFFELTLDGDILNELSTENWVWGSPAIDELGVVYLTDLGGYVHAFDSQRGMEKRWSVKVAERGIRTGPLVVDERVVVASRDGKVYWIDRRDGQLLNTREIDERPELLGDMMLLEPGDNLAIDEPLLLVSSVHDGRLLIAFELDGRQSWVYPR